MVGVNGCDFFIHLKQIAISFFDCVASQLFNGVFKIQEYGLTGIVHTVACIASFFGST